MLRSVLQINSEDILLHMMSLSAMAHEKFAKASYKSNKYLLSYNAIETHRTLCVSVRCALLQNEWENISKA